MDVALLPLYAQECKLSNDGLFRVHSSKQGARRVLRQFWRLGVCEQSLKPHVISSQIIRNIDPHQTQLINRTRKGQMILAGQTICVRAARA